MASSLRLPAGSIFPNARPTSLIAQSFASGSPQQQCRAFSAAAQRWAYRTQNFKPSSPAQPSMKSRAKDVMKHQLPNDIGLLPGTFVRPMWRDLPSIFQDPRDRFRMEWTWLKSVFQGYARWVCHLSLWKSRGFVHC
jgi:protein MBA1